MDFVTFLQRLGLMRFIITGGLIAGLGYFMYFATGHLNSPDMALLYGDLDVGDAGRIVSKLEDRNIPVDIRGGGTQVFVPVDMVGRLRMDMAEAGLPSGGSVGYEIFDKSDVFGTSFFVQNVNHVRALEGELARTIRTLSQIGSARVHLVLPKRELFSTNQQEPTASVVIRMQSPGRLDPSRVQSIQHLVASAVANLIPENVSIVDDRGNLLSSGKGGTSEVALASKAEEMRASYEQRMESAIRSLLERTLGVGKVRAQVAVEMNFDRLTENSEIFDPEGQVARSQQSVSEDNKSTEKSNATGASVANELPSSGGESTAGSSNEGRRTEETINYEISKTIRSHIKESGSIKRLSIAVLVDGVRKAGEEGAEGAYEPRSEDELKQIEKLVKSAVGFDAERGDKVEVINMEFTSDPIDIGETIEKGMFDFEPHHIIRIAESLVLGLVGLLMLLLVVRPLINRILEALAGPESEKTVIKQDNGGEDPTQIAQQQASQALPPPQTAPNSLPAPAANEDKVAMDNIDGEIKKSSMKKVSNIIEQHPEESVALVRSWMNQ